MLRLLSVVLLAGGVLWSPPAAAAAGPSGDPGPAAAGQGSPAWVDPVPTATSPQPTVVRGFDPPAGPYAAGHRGVDLLAAPGTPVRAAGDGVVTYAGPVAGRGVVTVTHGALRSTYEPVEPTVQVGQQVHAGDVIGHLSAGGTHCGLRSCLHWGLLDGATYLDPLALLRPARIRLLPVWGIAAPTRLQSILGQVTDAVLSTGAPGRAAPHRGPAPPRRDTAASAPSSGRAGDVARHAVGALGLVGAGAGALALRRRR